MVARIALNTGISKLFQADRNSISGVGPDPPRHERVCPRLETLRSEPAEVYRLLTMVLNEAIAADHPANRFGLIFQNADSRLDYGSRWALGLPRDTAQRITCTPPMIMR